MYKDLEDTVPSMPYLYNIREESRPLPQSEGSAWLITFGRKCCRHPLSPRLRQIQIPFVSKCSRRPMTSSLPCPGERDNPEKVGWRPSLVGWRPSQISSHPPFLSLGTIISNNINKPKYSTQTLHVWHICLHWGGLRGQSRHILVWYTWSVWGMLWLSWFHVKT